MYKVKNLTNDVRRFRERKTWKTYELKPKESVVIEYEPIENNPNIFEIRKVEKEEAGTEEKPKRRKTKSNKEV